MLYTGIWPQPHNYETITQYNMTPQSNVPHLHYYTCIYSWTLDCIQRWTLIMMKTVLHTITVFLQIMRYALRYHIIWTITVYFCWQYKVMAAFMACVVRLWPLVENTTIWKRMNFIQPAVTLPICAAGWSHWWILCFVRCFVHVCTIVEDVVWYSLPTQTIWVPGAYQICSHMW